nr:reverse transcriptase domain-containing protein [Tanacetum cinerariifolium]
MSIVFSDETRDMTYPDLAATPFVGFSGEITWPLRQILLWDPQETKNACSESSVVYRPCMIKFSTRVGAATIKSERAKSLEIQMVRKAVIPPPKPVESVKTKEKKTSARKEQIHSRISSKASGSRDNEKQMKKQVAELPTLTAPIEGETLIMYICATKEALSTVLLAERDDKQIRIYFVGKALQSPKINYTRMEKLVLALVHVARRLGEDNKNWVEELPHILWARRTMIKSSNENTPFILTYETEVVIPVEIGMTSLRCSMVDKNKNDEGLLLNFDLLEEKMELAAIAEEKHKIKMEGHYNSKVQSTILKPIDMVATMKPPSKKIRES